MVEKRKLSTEDRLCLIQTLNALPESQFDELVFALNPSKGNVPNNSNAQGRRSIALLQWVESSLGPGISDLEHVLENLANSDAADISTVPETQVTQAEETLREIIQFLKTPQPKNFFLLPISTPPTFPDFYGRRTELNQITRMFEKAQVVAIRGASGVGKTYFAAQLAHQVANDYKICWIDKEELTLEELLLQINEFLKSNGEYGFVTTYDEGKIESIHKIPSLVQVMSTSKLARYAIFIDSFQSANWTEIRPFIERYRTYGGDSRLVLVDHSPENSLGIFLASRVKQFSMSGFQHDEAVQYIEKRFEELEIVCLPTDMTAVIEKTAGHPLAIDLVIQWHSLLGNPMDNLLERLVEYDKRYGAELNKRLLENVAKNLALDERKALCVLSVLRTPVQRLIWEYLDIPDSIGESLLQRRLLTRVDNDKCQMHPLISEFWRASQSAQEVSLCHEKAARYYWEYGEKNVSDTLDYRAYLEAHYHYCQFGEVEKAAQVLEDLVRRSYQRERLSSERLAGLEEWLFSLSDAIFFDKPWILLEKGRKLEKQGSTTNAEHIFQSVYDKFEYVHNQLGASIALYHVGKMRHLAGQPQLALQAMNRVLKIAEKENDLPMQIRVLGKMVGCYIDIDRCDDARNVASDAYDFAIRSNDKLGLALILYRQGSIERHQSKFHEAEVFFARSAREFSRLGDVYRESKALSRLGICQNFQGRFEEAKTNLKRAIELKKSIDDQHGEARDLDYLADIYAHLGIYEKAEVYYRRSLEIKEGKGGIQPDLYGQIKAYNNLARIALSAGQLPEASKLIQESQERIDERDKRFVGVNGSCLMIKGDLQCSRGEYELALQSYEEADKCFSSPNPEVPSSRSRILLCLGQTNLVLGRLMQSEKFLEDSLKRFQEYRMSYYEAQALISLAKLRALTHSPARAEEHNKEALDIARSINSEHITINCIENQGLIEQYRILDNFPHENSDGDKDQQRQDLITLVWKYYDEAIQELTRKNKGELQIERIRIRKNFWLFAVKHFREEPIPNDDAYGLLQSDNISREILYVELLNTQHLLSALDSISSREMASKIGDFSLKVASPIAMRFGFNEVREQLEEYAFAFLFPDEYKAIDQALEHEFPQRRELIENLTSDLELLLDDIKVAAEIHPRAKTIYSIYTKKVARNIALDEILDIVGFRVIAQTDVDCYKILSVIQELGGFFKGEGVLKESLRDYIKHPKLTGYQSIHINIEYGEPRSRIIEFQIRTHRMHLAAEIGIGLLGQDQAAHRRYKDPAFYARPLSKRNYKSLQSRIVRVIVKCERKSVRAVANILRSSKFELLSVDLDKSIDKQLIFQLDLATRSERYTKESINEDLVIIIDNINEISGCKVIERSELKLQEKGLSTNDKALLLQELTLNSDNSDTSIYLITPRGDVKKLPKGSTPVDFAYRIHSKIGDHCAGARVNGQIFPIEKSLRTGDLVEIITQNNSHPSLDWLLSVKTGNARNRIRQWYKRENWRENINRGRELIQKELSKYNFEVKLESREMNAVIEQCNCHSLNDLLANVGHGELSAGRVVNRIREGSDNQQLRSKPPETLVPLSNGPKGTISGLEGLAYRLAACCSPVPDEPIIGIVKLAGHGISIHRQSCKNWNSIPNERLIEVSWNSEKDKTYPVYIRVEVCDEVGVLNGITGLLADLKINIQDIQMTRYPDRTAVIDLCLEISDLKQLQRTSSKLKKARGCLDVHRISR